MLMSCGGSQSALKESKLKTETLNAIINNYNKSNPDFKTMRGRLKGVYDDGRDQQSINISYRFQKNKTLWMSARFAGLFEVAKMMITPKKIKFYERIDNTYFNGNFELINLFIGLELNYSQIENLLLGEAVNPIIMKQTDFETLEDSYQILTRYDDDMTQSLWLDAKTFKVKQQVIRLGKRRVKIDYVSYQIVDNNSFPEEMTITAGGQKQKINLNLIYKSIKLNDDLRFPFKIPNNFSIIN